MVDGVEGAPPKTFRCEGNHSLEGLQGCFLGAILFPNNQTGQGPGIYKFGSRIHDGGRVCSQVH
jgi:hypothetical protein